MVRWMMFGRTSRVMRLSMVLVMALAVLLAVVPFGQVAQAQGADTGYFTIDGTVPDVPPPPVGVTVHQFADPFGVKELGPINGDDTKLNVIDDAIPPMLGYTTIDSKNDLKNVWMATNVVDVSGVDHVWLYFAWERVSNNGSAIVFFEFMQDPAPAECDMSLVGTPAESTLIGSCNPWANRRAGDFILVWDQVGQSQSIEISIRTFNGTAFGPKVKLTDAQAAATIGDNGYRGEAAIDLTAAGVFPDPPTTCKTFATVIPGTITGNSDTADYKDVVLADFASKVGVSSCGSITGFKWLDQNTDGFPDAGEGKLSGWTIQLCSNSTCSLPGDPLQTTTTDGDGNYIFHALPGTYYVREVLPTGWVQTFPSGGYHGPLVVTGPDCHLTGKHFGNYLAAPQIDIEKYTNGADVNTEPGPFIAVGSPVTWTYQVTNTGNVALTNVRVVDDRGVTVTCPKAVLDKGESMTCAGSGTAQTGQYANIGAATGTPPVGPDVTDTDPSYYFGSSPSISIMKSTNGEDADDAPGPYIAVGGAVNWTYLVTNTGNVPLSDVTATDDQAVAVTCTQTGLAVNESMTCTASGTAVAGQYANIGSVSGTPPAGDDVTASDPSHYFGFDARVKITPSTATNPVNSPHTFTVQVQVDYGAGFVAPAAGTQVSISAGVSPAPGTMTDNCTGQTIAGGQCTVVINSATAGTFTANATAKVTVGGVELTRSTSGDSGPGGTGPAEKKYVDARITVTPADATNPVNVLHTFTVQVQVDYGDGNGFVAPKADTLVSVSVDVTPAPGTIADNCTGKAIIGGLCTVDINSATPGTFTANAYATIQVSLGQPVAPVAGLIEVNQLPYLTLVRDTDPTTLDTAGPGGSGPATKTYVMPGIDIVKTPSATLIYRGGSVTYSYDVTSTTAIPLMDVVVTDDKCAPVTYVGGDAGTIGLLEEGETWQYTCTTSLAVTTLNTATVTAMDENENPVSATDTAEVAVIAPAIQVVKTASAAIVTSGDPVTYTYDVTNPGDDPLSNVTLTDDKCTPVTYVGGDSNNDGILDLSETWTYTCTMTLTAITENTATVTGTDTLGAPVTDTDSVIVDVEAPITSVELTAWQSLGGSDSVAHTWATAWEKGTAAFRFYRGSTADKAAATLVAEIGATGTTNAGSSYAYTDAGLSAGTYYYWLVELTEDGTEAQIAGPREVVVGGSAQARTRKVFIPISIRR